MFLALEADAKLTGPADRCARRPHMKICAFEHLAKAHPGPGESSSSPRPYQRRPERRTSPAVSRTAATRVPGLHSIDQLSKLLCKSRPLCLSRFLLVIGKY